MPKFREHPVVIEAMQFDGSWESAKPILEWMEPSWQTGRPGARWSDANMAGPYLHIDTLAGEMTASPGDWVIRRVSNEFYPCKPGIFDATYKPV